MAAIAARPTTVQVVTAGGEPLGQEAGDKGREGHRQRDQPVIEAEDAPADGIRRRPLQPVRGEGPLRAAAQVAGKDRERRERQDRRQRKECIADREDAERGRDAPDQPTLADADDRPDQEWTDERAQPAGREQDPDPRVTGLEDVATEHRQQHDDAGAHPERGLREEERRQGPVAARKAQHDPDRLRDAPTLTVPRRTRVLLASHVSEGPPNADDQQSRRRERCRIDGEGDVSPQGGGHQAAQRRADRQHRAPR